MAFLWQLRLLTLVHKLGCKSFITASQLVLNLNEVDFCSSLLLFASQLFFLVHPGSNLTLCSLHAAATLFHDAVTNSEQAGGFRIALLLRCVTSSWI